MAHARSLEEVFIKEFKQNIRTVGNRDIASIPLPKECKDWEVSGTDEYAIKGIIETSYQGLNKTIVRRMPREFEAKRRAIDKITRGYKKNSEGKFIYEDYAVPTGSMVVLSEKEIGLSYQDYLKPTKSGYGYIDFRIIKGVKTFMYVVPKEVLYKVNQTALALTVKSMTCYDGYGYKTWSRGVIYLYTIPYFPNRRYDATRILKTGHTLDYSKEMKLISNYWEGINLIPNISLSSLQMGENLCLKAVTIRADLDYSPIEMLPISTKEIYGGEEGNMEMGGSSY